MLRPIFRLSLLAILLGACTRPNLLPVIVSDPVFSVMSGSVVSQSNTVPGCGVVRIQVTAYDPDGGQLKYSYQASPVGSLEQVSPQSASVSWVLDPAPSSDIPVNMNVTVTDPAGGTASRNVSWVVKGGPLQFCGVIQGRAVPGLKYLSDVPSSADFLPNQAIVKFKSNANRVAAQSLGNSSFVEPIADGVGVLRMNTTIRTQATKTQSINTEPTNTTSDPKQETLAWIAELRARPDVEYAEPNYFIHTQNIPNDPLYTNTNNLTDAGTGQQWHYQQLNLPAAWDISTGDPAVVVAVVDTGILYSQTNPALRHPDFDCLVNGQSKVLPGYDFGKNDPDPFDDQPSGSFHGTHVAGTIGACANNGIGGAGVAWKTRILPVRAIVGSSGSIAAVARSIRWAAGESIAGVPDNPNPAQIINLSLGEKLSVQKTLQAAVDAAIARGAVVVSAAGNANTGTTPGDAFDYTPANLHGVIVVGALGPNKALAPYSYFGSKLTVVAPGGNIAVRSQAGDGVLSTAGCRAVAVDSPRFMGLIPPCDPGTDFGYAFLQGTSMAAPHVSGVIALMMAARAELRDPAANGLDPSQNWARVMRLLRASASTSGLTACEPGCGAGLLDANNALIQTQNNIVPIGPLLNVVSLSKASKNVGVLDLGTTLNQGTAVIRNDGDEIANIGSNVVGPGLSISPSSFALEPGQEKTFTISLNRPAVNPLGQYAARIVLDDASGRPISLRVYYQQGAGTLPSAAGYKVRLFQPGFDASGNPIRRRLTYPGVDLDADGRFKFTGLSTSSKYIVSVYRTDSTNTDGTVVTNMFGERPDVFPVAEGLSDTEIPVNPSTGTICSEAGTPNAGPTACP